jgi:hypothetical protein
MGIGRAVAGGEGWGEGNQGSPAQGRVKIACDIKGWPGFGWAVGCKPDDDRRGITVEVKVGICADGRDAGPQEQLSRGPGCQRDCRGGFCW